MKSKASIITLRLLFSITAISIMSCSSEQKQTSNRTEFEESLTNSDSIAVRDLIDKFFTAVISEQYSTAAAMLYQIDVDNVYETPMPLENEQMHGVKIMLKSFGIVDYRIDYIKFRQSYSNEVKCTAIMQKASDTTAEINTHLYFKPVSYLGNWVLCMMNSSTGDNPIVDDSERDSLEQQYKSGISENDTIPSGNLK